MSVNPVKRAVVRACTDGSYRARLLNDPRKALAEEGIQVPPDVEIRVHESSEERLMVVLPAARGGDLTGQGQPPLPAGRVDGVPDGLTLDWQGDTLVAAGRIDSSTAPAFRRELEKAFVDIDVDMSGVEFLSSAGLGALLAAQKHLAAHDSNLRLMDVPEEVRNVLELAGFIDLFEIASSAMEQAYLTAPFLV